MKTLSILPRHSLLAHRAFERFPALADAPLIRLYHLLFYTNLKSHLRKQSAAGTFLEPIGAVMVASKAYPLIPVSVSPVEAGIF